MLDSKFHHFGRQGTFPPFDLSRRMTLVSFNKTVQSLLLQSKPFWYCQFTPSSLGIGKGREERVPSVDMSAQTWNSSPPPTTHPPAPSDRERANFPKARPIWPVISETSHLKKRAAPAKPLLAYWDLHTFSYKRLFISGNKVKRSQWAWAMKLPR